MDELAPVRIKIAEVMQRAPSEMTVDEIARHVTSQTPCSYWEVHDGLRDLRLEGKLEWITVEDDPEVVSPHQLVRCIRRR